MASLAFRIPAADEAMCCEPILERLAPRPKKRPGHEILIWSTAAAWMNFYLFCNKVIGSWILIFSASTRKISKTMTRQ